MNLYKNDIITVGDEKDSNLNILRIWWALGSSNSTIYFSISKAFRLNGKKYNKGNYKMSFVVFDRSAGFDEHCALKDSVRFFDQREKLLDDLFSADAFIMDEWSKKFMKIYEDGLDKLQIIEMLDDGEN